MMGLLSAFSLVTGAAICLLASVGVLRLPDFFMRMHAATKAGVVGCGLLLFGVAFAEPSPGMWIKVAIAITFLLLTTPISGHLLARAGYVGGVPIWTGTRKDQLRGELHRGDFERLGHRKPKLTGGHVDLGMASAIVHLPAVKSVRFGVVRDQVRFVATRAFALADTIGITPSAHIIIDEGTVEAARNSTEARDAIQQAAQQALGQLDVLIGDTGRSVDIRFEEGDPEYLLPVADGADVLLLMPSEGWFDHGTDLPTPSMSWGPDGLLRLPSLHGGPLLFSGSRPIPLRNQKIVIRDDGAPHIPQLVLWALENGIWRNPKLHLVWQGDEMRHQQIAAIAAEFAASLTLHKLATVEPGASNIPKPLADADAIVLGATPRPLRANWYGHKWTDRISQGWSGEILLMKEVLLKTGMTVPSRLPTHQMVQQPYMMQGPNGLHRIPEDGQSRSRPFNRRNDNSTGIAEVVVALANGVDTNDTIDEAISLAKSHRVPLVGLAIIDTKILRYTGVLPIGGMSYAANLKSGLVEKARRSLADTVQSFELRAQDAGVFFSLFVEEGDPVRIIRTRQEPQTLMLIGRDDWFDHGIAGGRNNPLEYLVRRGVYPLVSVTKSPPTIHTINFIHDGTPHSDNTLQWFLDCDPWPQAELRLLPDTTNHPDEIANAHELAAGRMGVAGKTGEARSIDHTRPQVVIFGNQGHAGWINRARMALPSQYNDVPIVIFG